MTFARITRFAEALYQYSFLLLDKVTLAKEFLSSNLEKIDEHSKLITQGKYDLLEKYIKETGKKYSQKQNNIKTHDKLSEKTKKLIEKRKE